MRLLVTGATGFVGREVVHQFINVFTRLIRLSPVVPLIGSTRARFQPVSVEAVAAALKKSLGEPNSIGQTYDLCGPEALTLAEIVDRILAALQRRRLKLQMLPGLAWCQAALLELVFRRLLRKASPLNRDQLIMLRENNVGNPQPANELFRLEQVPFREGIAKFLMRDAGEGAFPASLLTHHASRQTSIP